MEKRLYQLTRKEAQLRGATSEWDAFWEHVKYCSNILTTQNCSPPFMEQTIQRTAAQVGGIEPIACLLAGELRRRSRSDCVIDTVFEWASSPDYDTAEPGPIVCGLLSFVLSTTSKYVMELACMVPAMRLVEKISVEFGIFCGQLPWGDRDRLADAAGELAVKHYIKRAVSQLERDDKLAGCLLAQENALDFLYTTYVKQTPSLESQVESMIKNSASGKKQPVADMLLLSCNWGKQHED